MYMLLSARWHVVAAGVRPLVAQAAQLNQVATQRPFGDSGAFGQLEGVEAWLRDDHRKDPEKANEPAGSIHAAEAWLADFFPGGRVALERVGLGLLLVPHLLVEPAGDHLVRHRLGNAELGERLHLVGHDLVSGSLDSSQNLFDGRRLLGHW